MSSPLFAGRFRLIEVLGRGGMGAVWRAEQVALKREVAVKLMHPYLTQAPGMADRFLREGQVLARLHHPRCTEVYDLGEADGTFFIAMELLRGSGLDDLLRAGGPMAAPRAIGIAVQVLEALEAAHALGIVHRDLKPANVFVLSRGPRPAVEPPAEAAGDRVKVLDFGLAFLRDEEAGRITRQGQTAGTPAYMAPEQCRGEQVDGRADLYALACTLYEMLSGAPPFGYGEENAMEVMAAHLYQPPTSLAQQRWDLGIPAPVEAAVLRGLAKLKKDRFDDAAQMRTKLLEALEASAAAPELRGAGQGRERGPAEVPLQPPQVAAAVPVGIVAAGALGSALALMLGASGVTTVALGQEPEAQLGGLGALLVAAEPAPAGLDRARRLAARGLPVLLCGPEDDLQLMAAAIGAGVFDYVSLPLDPVELSRKVSRAVRRHGLPGHAT